MLRRQPAILPACALMLSVLSGCGITPPVEPERPPFTARVTHFAGSPHTGARDVEGEAGPEDFRSVQVTFLTLQDLPVDFLDTAASRARGIFSIGEKMELVPTLVLARGARYGDGPDADLPLPASTKIATLTGVIARGFSAEFSLREEDAVNEATATGFLRIFVYQTRDSGETWMSFILEALPDDEYDVVIEMESAFFPLPPAAGDRATLILPADFTEKSRAIAIQVRLSDPPAPGSREGSEFRTRVLDSLGEATEIAALKQARAVPLSDHAMVERAVLKAVDAAGDLDGGRRTFVFLAGATDAALAEDLALMARDDSFLYFMKGVIGELAKQQGEAEPLEIGWILEGWACKTVLSAQARGEVQPELTTSLIRHAGEVGRHGGLLADIAVKSRSLEEFHRLLISENFTFLLDPEPASRVWAYDWLEEQGRAPAGYDPLGNLEDRREALLQAIREADREQ